VNDSRPFPVSFFCEDGEKPPNLNLYLEPFLNELIKPLEENGIDVNDRHLMVKSIAFICDASARSLVKGIYVKGNMSSFKNTLKILLPLTNLSRELKTAPLHLKVSSRRKKGLPGRSYIAVRMEWNLMGLSIGNRAEKRVDMEQLLKLFTLRFIDLTALAKKHGEQLSKEILGFHAFTGCDNNPAFASKGKSAL
jgi:hypothetical protein